jgi:hypothetical protein
MAGHIAPVCKLRLRRRMGHLDPKGLTAVDRAIRIQPALWLRPA